MLAGLSQLPAPRSGTCLTSASQTRRGCTLRLHPRWLAAAWRRQVKLDGRASAAVDEFDTFVRPTLSPVLPAFSTELTGITQARAFRGLRMTLRGMLAAVVVGAHFARGMTPAFAVVAAAVAVAAAVCVVAAARHATVTRQLTGVCHRGPD